MGALSAFAVLHSMNVFSVLENIEHGSISGETGIPLQILYL